MRLLSLLGGLGEITRAYFRGTQYSHQNYPISQASDPRRQCPEHKRVHHARDAAPVGGRKWGGRGRAFDPSHDAYAPPSLSFSVAAPAFQPPLYVDREPADDHPRHPDPIGPHNSNTPY